MSRIGKMPITLPEGVKLSVEGNKVTVTGPLGTLSRVIDTDKISVSVDGNIVTINRANDEKEIRAKHGLYRALINNMVKGVKEGFKKTLVVNGVGYKLNKQGNKLVLDIGFSDEKFVEEVEGIKLTVVDATTIEVSGIDKELVGQMASKIRDLKPVEPYHAYGIKYSDEYVVRKEGKKAAAKK